MDEGGGGGKPRAGLLLAVLLAGVVGGLISGGAVALLTDGSGDRGAAETAGRVERRGVVQEEGLVSEAVAAALPAVVTVINEQAPRQDNLGRTVEGVSVGSGVIIDARGFIVTNEHVVRNAVKVTVVLNDGQERAATIVSHDAPFTDLAVLRVSPGGLKALRLADSDALVLGQTVVAIGSALFEYRNSVSSGIVSGLHRRWLREGVYMEDLVQTDAAINSGNSGGPLINTRAEVVGLTTNVVRRLGTAENVFGVSFAISSNTIAPIAKSIMEQGRYARPYFGIEHQDIDEEVAAQNNLRTDRGALVRRVIDGGPAQAAGIRSGDIILRIDRFELSDDLPFVNVLARLTANQRVRVQLLRDSQTRELQVEVASR